MTEKEKRVVAYHEAGHALMSHLVGEPQPVQKVTIVSRGIALGYTLHTPQEDRYLSHEGGADRPHEGAASAAARPSRSSSARSRTAPPTTSSA